MKKPTPSVRAALVVLLVVAATCALPLLKLTLREHAAHFSLTGKAFVDVELAYQAASLAMVALFSMLAGNGTDLTCGEHADRLMVQLLRGGTATASDLLGSAVVVCCWTIVPLVVAAFVFERRDLVSDA
jgi:hypothetical protein